MDIGKWEQAKRWLTRPKGINEKALDDYHDDSSVDRGYGVGYRPRSIPDNFVPVMPQAPGLQDPATSIKELATGGRVSLGKGGGVSNRLKRWFSKPEVKNIIVGHTIKKEKPCTQTELAKALGVTFQQIQKYEKGFNGLSSIKLLKISKFFNKPLEYFTSDATDLLGQNNLPDKNPNVALAPSNVTGLN